ncbi:Uncharacterised protein [uncultured Blautia sp.]|nr:Uncharacterised protein [uncultured Blautia sp.]
MNKEIKELVKNCGKLVFHVLILMGLIAFLIAVIVRCF